VCTNTDQLSLQGLYAVAIVWEVTGKPRLKKGKNSPELLTSESSDMNGSEDGKLQAYT
jgi:hypothetical protein